MKWLRWLKIYITVVLSVLSIACTETKKSEQSSLNADKKAITAVSAARAEAFNNSNAAEIASHFTEGAVLMAPGKPTSKGREAVETYYQSIFDEYKPELDSRYVEIRVSGDIAYARGIAHVTLIPKNGSKTTTSTAKYLNILERQSDDTWKTTHDIWNSNEE